jgi:hypothetical protein
LIVQALAIRKKAVTEIRMVRVMTGSHVFPGYPGDRSFALFIDGDLRSASGPAL